MSETQIIAQQEPAAASAAPEAESEFSRLLTREFKPKSDTARQAVQTAVQTLAQQALAHTTLISDDVFQTISGMIAEVDLKLTEQVNLIIHHEEFQQLESAWRGLHHLVNNTE